jgi:hypothetical protein
MSDDGVQEAPVLASIPPLFVRSAHRQSPGWRRASRHTVELPCEVITSNDDEPVLVWATDMSVEGLWLETSRSLELKEELVVCFKPTVWWHARELVLFGEVARVSPGLRHGDGGPGVGVCFTDLERGERFALMSWLRPRPELPARRRAPARPRTFEERFSSHPFAARLS